MNCTRQSEQTVNRKKRKGMPKRRNSISKGDRTSGGRKIEWGLLAGTSVTGPQRALSDNQLPWPIGYLIIHVVQTLCGMVIMYSLVLPIIHNRAREMLQGLSIGM